MEECVSVLFNIPPNSLNIINNQYVNSLVEVNEIVGRIVTYRNRCIVLGINVRIHTIPAFLGV